jgi:transcription initiation factor TFIIIB Brf1 subunit/transcription initiation factor TFIIB
MRLKCVQVRRDFTVIALARDLPMLWCAASPSWRVPYFVIRLGAIGSLAGKVSSMVINQLLLALRQVLAGNPITGRIGVLGVIASENSKRGDCRLTNKEIVDVAGVSVTTVKNAMRAARGPKPADG